MISLPGTHVIVIHDQDSYFLTLVLVTATVSVAAVCWALGITMPLNLAVSATPRLRLPPTTTAPSTTTCWPNFWPTTGVASKAKTGCDRNLTRPGGANRILSQPHPLLNELAPDFTLKDQHEQAWDLHAESREGPGGA